MANAPRRRTKHVALRDRPVSEIIVISLTVVVCIIIVLLTAALVFTTIFRPDADLIGAARVISSIVNTVIGALIGYMAGTKFSQNGKD